MSIAARTSRRARAGACAWRSFAVAALPALLASLAAAPAVAASAGPSPLLLPLRSLGGDPTVAEQLDTRIRAEAILYGVRLVGREQTAKLLAGEAPECEGDPACLARVARSAGATRAISGVAAELGDSWVVTLRLLDPAAGVELSRVSERFRTSGDGLVRAARSATCRLFAPERYVGELEVRVKLDGASVFLDGQAIGTSPLPGPIPNLQPGPHALRIRREGFDDFERFVDVSFGQRAVVVVDLRDATISAELRPLGEAVGAVPPAALQAGSPDAPGHGWLKTGVTSIAGTGLVAGGIFAVLAASGRSGAADQCQDPQDCTQAQVDRLNRRNDQYVTTSTVLLVVGAAAGGAAAALWLSDAEAGP